MIEIVSKRKNMQVKYDGTILYLTYDYSKDYLTAGFRLDSFELDSTANKADFVIGLKRLGIQITNPEAWRLLYILTN